MKCPCGAIFKNLETRNTAFGVRRRRQCPSCFKRVTTLETISGELLPREAFDDMREQVSELRRHNQNLRNEIYRLRSALKRPDVYKAKCRRDYLRRNARKEAAETGEDVHVIYERWGVN